MSLLPAGNSFRYRSSHAEASLGKAFATTLPLISIRDIAAAGVFSAARCAPKTPDAALRQRFTTLFDAHDASGACRQQHIHVRHVRPGRRRRMRARTSNSAQEAALSSWLKKMPVDAQALKMP